MIIDLTKLTIDEEAPLLHEYNAAVEELEFDDCHYTRPIHFEGSALLQKDALSVKGNVTSTCEVTCSRCLKQFTFDINEHVDGIFDVKGKKSLDITNDIREHIIFLHEQQYLCSVECKGLCPQCGIDLNSETCDCANKLNKSKFAKLKSFFREKKE